MTQNILKRTYLFCFKDKQNNKHARLFVCHANTVETAFALYCSTARSIGFHVGEDNLKLLFGIEIKE